jgi:hypothetical protein
MSYLVRQGIREGTQSRKRVVGRCLAVDADRERTAAQVRRLTDDYRAVVYITADYFAVRAERRRAGLQIACP